MTNTIVRDLLQWLQESCSKTDFGEVTIAVTMHAGQPRKVKKTISESTQESVVGESSAPGTEKNRP